MKTKSVLPFILIFVSACIQLNAATFTVTNTTDADPGSLRAAINSANALAGADTIVFDSTVFASPQTITVASFLPINSDLVIIGPGADLLAISGNNVTRIFHDGDISMNDVVISGLEIKNGHDTFGPALDIMNAHVTIRHCDIHGNSVGHSGAILVRSIMTPGSSSLTIENSSIHHNTGGVVAGIYMGDAASLTVSNSTIFANSGSSGDGQAIKVDGSNLVLTNVTIAGHSTGSNAISLRTIEIPDHHNPDTIVHSSLTVRNCIFDNPIENYSAEPGTMKTSHGHNISNDGTMSFLTAPGDMQNTSALLDTAGLQDNGGTTPTVALQCGSPAVNSANPATTSADQRGVAVVGGIRDIGAYESNLLLPTLTGPDSVCGWSFVTYTTQPGMTNYAWTVSGTAGTDYDITPINGGGGPGNNFIQLRWTTNGNKTVTVSYHDSTLTFCSSTQASKSTTVTGAISPIVGGPSNVCQNRTATYSLLNQIPGATFDWVVDGSAADRSITSGGGSADTFITVQWITPGSRLIELDYTLSSGCGREDLRSITVRPNPVCSITGNETACPGAATQWCAPAGLNYLWSTGHTSQCINPAASGTYTVTVRNSFNCSSTCSRQLTVFPVINVDAGPNKFVYKGYADSTCTILQSTISGGTAPLTKQWTKSGSPAILGTGNSLNVCPTANSVYYLTVTDASGCTRKDSVKVCVFDVRCGSGNKKVTVCHGTGSATNPFVTLCITPADAFWHFLNHPGEKLGACGMVKACTFPNAGRLDEELVIAEGVEFLGAFPNPFSSITTIRFLLPTDDVVSVKVFDVMGRVVENIYDGKVEAEKMYTTEFDGSRFTKGIYFLVLNAQSGFTQTSKLVLDK